MANGTAARLYDQVSRSRLWKSFFRTRYPDDTQQRSMLVLTNTFLHLHAVKVSRRGVRATYTFCLGGLSFFFFLALTLTGLLLMFYYVPSVDMAYTSMKDLASSVAMGTLLRNLHRWGAHGMVILVFLHMIRVFYTGAYKPPREFNWVIGVVLLVLTLLLSFTGYLLPWDQLSYWAITVGTNMVGSAPIVGEQMRFLLLGGYEVGQNALVRFYVLHVIVLPLVLAALLAIHFYRIRKDGGISQPL